MDVVLGLVALVLGYTTIGTVTTYALLRAEGTGRGDIPEWMILTGPLLWPLIWICCILFGLLWVTLTVLFWFVDRWSRG